MFWLLFAQIDFMVMEMRGAPEPRPGLSDSQTSGADQNLINENIIGKNHDSHAGNTDGIVIDMHGRNGVGIGKNDTDEEDADGDFREKSSGPAKLILVCRHGLTSATSHHRSSLKVITKVVFLAAVGAYAFFTVRHGLGGTDSAVALAICCLVVVGVLHSFVSESCRAKLSRLRPKKRQVFGCSRRTSRIIYWVVLGAAITGLVAYVLVDTAMTRPSNLWSLMGVLVIIAVAFCLSKHPGKVRWRVVIWGLLLQFIFGLLVLRTSRGYDSFQWITQRLSLYLDHAKAGSRFVFGESFAEHYFAFVLLPTIVMFNATISVLYYLGVMRVFINAISLVIRKSLGTGPMETLHATFNIFIGWAETIAVVSPLINEMTSSELHAIMTNGFATASGGAVAAYVVYGAPPNHLIAASFMSAPAALALSKLFYPEVKLNRQKLKTPKIVKSERSVIEAASTGAINSIPLVAYILVHLIAFVSILDSINSFIAWLGARVGIEPPEYPALSFQYMSSYVMSPVALVMGVEPSEARVSGRMLGMKIFVNEFLAFQDLGHVLRNTAKLRNYTAFFPNATWHWTRTDDVFLNATGSTLVGGVMSARTAVITTYALCGFSDFIALGMMVGALTAAAPGRKQDILRVAPRALLTGIMANFLTASLAGLLME